MTPGTISRLLNEAERVKKDKYDTIVSFSLSWIAWEGVRSRVLIVAARLAGWRMEEAKDAIGSKKISSSRSFAQCLKWITGFNLDSDLKGKPAAAWQAARKIEGLRHRLFHGFEPIPEDRLQPASTAIYEFARNPILIFGQIPVIGPDSNTRQLGDPLRLRPAAGLGINVYRSLVDLNALLGNKAEAQEKTRLPPRQVAENWSKILTSNK